MKLQKKNSKCVKNCQYQNKDKLIIIFSQLRQMRLESAEKDKNYNYCWTILGRNANQSRKLNSLWNKLENLKKSFPDNHKRKWA